MKAGGIIPVALQRGDHAGDRTAIASGILQEFLDGGVEALAQKAEQLAVVLEAQPEHLHYSARIGKKKMTINWSDLEEKLANARSHSAVV